MTMKGVFIAREVCFGNWKKENILKQVA